MMTIKDFHKINGMLISFRVLIYDAMYLFPRQPVGYWIMIGLPRLFEIYFSKFYWDHWFDGDMTPSLILATWVIILFGGGMNKDTLWPNRKLGSKFLTIMIFFLGPLLWGIHQYQIYNDAKHVKNVMNKAFPGYKSNFEPYSLSHSLLNSYGGKNTIRPKETMTYKITQSYWDESTCHESRIFALPGDHFFKESKAELVNGNIALDVYYNNKNIPKKKIVMYIHGGGWKQGSKKFIQVNYHGGIPHYLLDNDYIIVSVAYRLTCTGIDPQDMISDISDAVGYVKENAYLWNGDPSQIILWGTSAGGNLALLASYKNDLGVKGVVAHYAPTEMRQDVIEINGIWEQIHTSVFIKATRILCGSPKASPDCFKQMSPTTHVTKSSPPTLLIHGHYDPLVLVSHAQLLASKLEKYNVPHALINVTGSHDCDVLVSSPCGQASLYSLHIFLQAVTK